MALRWLLLWLLLGVFCAAGTMLDGNARAAGQGETVGDMFRAVERGDVRLPGSRQARPLPLGDPSGLPGTEISPEDMAKAFPAPLKGSARPMELTPAPAPLLPMESTVPAGGRERPAPPRDPLTELLTKSGTNPGTAPVAPALATPQGKGLQPQATTPAVPARQAGKGSEAAATADKKAPPTRPTVEMMLGQMIMAGFTDAELQNNSQVLGLIQQGRLGGVWLVPAAQGGGKPGRAGGNIVSPPQMRVLTATLQKAARESKSGIPLFVTVEQEGGFVQALNPRQGFEGGAAAARLGRGTQAATEVEGRRTGLEMAALGCNFNLAPAGDVNVNPLSEEVGRRMRSFSPDPGQVTAHALAFGKGLAAVKVVPCLRNFPGTGSLVRGFGGFAGTASNALASLPDIGPSWRSLELGPYAEILRQDWPGAVQPALVFHRGLDGLNPVTLSRSMLTDILRGRLGFAGVVVTGDLRELSRFYPLEDAILLAVQAGADIMLVSEPQGAVAPGMQDTVAPESQALAVPSRTEMLQNLLLQASGQGNPAAPAKTGQATLGAQVYDILLRLTRQGRISEDRVRESWLRIMALKKKFLYTPLTQ